MPTISVIVPVYKVEPYLRRCVDSVLEQTYQDFELILVDDGSPDNCGAICDEYAAKDPRIRVIHKENGGASSARNAGLDTAKGTFIAFVDGDDRILPSLLSEALSGIEGYDSVCFNYHRENLSGQIESTSSYPACVYRWGNEKELFWFLFSSYFSYCCGFAVWNRLFRKRIIDRHRIRFEPHASYAEDLFFNVLYYLHSGSVNCLSGDYYSYLIRPESIIQSMPSRGHLNRVIEMVKALEAHLSSQKGFPLLEDKYSILFYEIVNNELEYVRRAHSRSSVKEIRTIIYSDVQDLPYFRAKTAELMHHRKDLQLRYGFIHSCEIVSEFQFYLDGNFFAYRCRQLMLKPLKFARKIMRNH